MIESQSKPHKEKNDSLIETKRLVLRRFSESDIDAVYRIFSDFELNRFLPWFPLEDRADAERFFEERYKENSSLREGCGFAVCLKSDNQPIGYIHVSGDDSHDIGYGLLKEFRGKGIMSEAVRAVINEARKENIAYLTATHDVENPASGYVMQAAGMRYMYTYKEFWLPKKMPVLFRLYQINLDGNEDRVYTKYKEMYHENFVENILSD